MDARPVENAALQQIGKGFRLLRLLVAATGQRQKEGEGGERKEFSAGAHRADLRHPGLQISATQEDLSPLNGQLIGNSRTDRAAGIGDMDLKGLIAAASSMAPETRSHSFPVPAVFLGCNPPPFSKFMRNHDNK
jgi:hypothetical protein